MCHAHPVCLMPRGAGYLLAVSGKGLLIDSHVRILLGLQDAHENVSLFVANTHAHAHP